MAGSDGRHLTHRMVVRRPFKPSKWPAWRPCPRQSGGWTIAGLAANKPAMLRRLYDWCIAAAGKPYATWLLGIVSFVESSFFPIPPDVMLIPMALARPDKACFYATVCTVTSVAGGLLGYLIGAVLYDSVGLWLIQLYGYGDKVEAFREAYAEWGAWIILLKGLTPIPYKIVTIASGFAGYNLFCSSCCRSSRGACAFSCSRFCSTAMARRRV